MDPEKGSFVVKSYEKINFELKFMTARLKLQTHSGPASEKHAKGWWSELRGLTKWRSGVKTELQFRSASRWKPVLAAAICLAPSIAIAQLQQESGGLCLLPIADHVQLAPDTDDLDVRGMIAFAPPSGDCGMFGPDVHAELDAAVRRFFAARRVDAFSTSAATDRAAEDLSRSISEVIGAAALVPVRFRELRVD